MPSSLAIAWTTVATQKDAETLAKGIIATRLAACVQIDGAIQSYYTWEGATQNEPEYRLMIKFPQKHEKALSTWVQQHHPYTTPQWIVVYALEAGKGYEDWVMSITD